MNQLTLLIHGLPWALPGLLVVALITSAVHRRLARLLHLPMGLAAALLLCFGAIASLTLTPSQHGQVLLVPACGLDLSPPLSFKGFFSISQRSLNVLLFVPLGALSLLVPDRRAAGWLFAAALVLPSAIEAIQYSVPTLGRYCQARDVIDNLTGLLAGGLGGLLLWLVLDTTRAPDE